MRAAKRRIAVLIDWYLPGTKAGGPVRSVYSLVQLLKNDYEFYIITTNADLGSDEPYKEVNADQWTIREQVNYYYFSRACLSPNKMKSVLNDIRPDLIYLNSLWSYPFSISLLRMRKKGELTAPVILAPRGMFGKGAMGLKSVKKLLFLRLAKMTGLYRSLRFHATNEQERADILRRLPHAQVMLAPNINAATAVGNRSKKNDRGLSLFFLSRISKVKNLHFALELLKKVSPSIRVTYDIYGNIEDEAYWTDCKDLISTMPSNIEVSYKGELPFHKVQETAATYNGLLLPTLNENFGHSIVESLFCGCIVIISDQTPWNGVNQAGGYALPLDSQDPFVAAIESCAQLSQEEFRSRSAAAIEYITKKTDLAAAASKYKSLFDGTSTD